MRHSAAVVVLFLLATANLSAATFPPTEDRDLVERADLIVVGTVLDSSSRMEERRIWTTSTLAVERVLKGTHSASTIDITELGGHADGKIMLIPGSAQYTKAERVLVFLRQRENGTWLTASMSLGRFRFRSLPDGRAIVTRDLDGAEVETDEAPRLADEFIEHVLDLVRGVSTPRQLTRITVDVDHAELEPRTLALPSAYVFKGGSPERPIRWPNCESGCTINYKVSGGAQPNATDTVGGIETAMGLWTNHVDSFVNLNLSGISGVDNVTSGDDNENTIALNNTASPQISGCDGASACGIVWAFSAVTHTFQSETFYTAFEGDMYLRPGAITSQKLFELYMTHELGHTMALKHAPTSGKIMSPSLSESMSVSLKDYDREAMSVVYGNGATSCESPNITTTSGGGNVTQGNTRQLSVSATGTAPLTYQWYQGENGDTSTPVGTNSSTYTTPPVNTVMKFWVKVSNSCGFANSATITVTPVDNQCTPANITVEPLSQTIAPNGTATLTVNATGTLPLTYQWFQGPVGDTSTPVGFNSNNFTTPPLLVTTSYWVKVSNSCGNDSSVLATITVSAQCVQVTIVNQPAPINLLVGNGATLNVTTAGTAPITFQWYQGDSPSEASPIAGATNSSFAAGPFNAAGTYKFWVKATNACGSANSGTIVITVACPTINIPIIAAPPASHFSSGYDVSWTGDLALTSSFELQEATNAAFTENVKTFIVTGALEQHILPHTEIITDTRFYYRVRAINGCTLVATAYSNHVSTVVTRPLPENSTEFSISVPQGQAVTFKQNYLVPGFGETATNGDTFAITTDVPWLTVFPASGALSAGGTTVQLTIATSGLDVGTTTGTVNVVRTQPSSSRIGTTGSTTSSVPFSISLVTPVTSQPRNTTAPPGTLVIPAIAHADGIGTRFQSDVRITNASTSPITYELTFTPSGSNGTQVGKKTTLVIGANDTKGLDDIVKAWYGSGVLGETGLGTLEIRPMTEGANPLATFASSRTYAISSAGTLGQFIPAIPLVDFIADINQNALQKISLQQIANSAAYRTNFGFVEGAGGTAQILVKLLDANNTVLQQVTRTLQPYGHEQISYAALFGNVPLSDGRVEVSVTSSAGKATAYASVVDNNTSDPLLVFPEQAEAFTAQHYVVPGIAELNNGASNFHSDMRVYNAGSLPMTVDLKYYPQGSPTPNPNTIQRTITPGKVLAIDNVLPSLWQLDATGGAVTVDAPSNASLVVTARTYSRNSSGGTFGQFIPGVTARDAAGLGERALEVMQLEQSAQYRTNLGLAEVTGKPVTVELMAYKPDTKTTAVTAVGLQANEFRQIGLIFQQMGLPTVYNGRVTVKVIGGEGRVAAYGSVVDNRTVDPTYVPSQ